MAEEKLHIPYPIIVEGRYDKIKLDALVCAKILVTDGFAVFREAEKAAYFRRLAEKSKLIIFTDSDGGGRIIRNYFNRLLPQDRLIHLYTPQITGKERRKAAPSRAGYLGVEGVDAAILRRLLEPFADSAAPLSPKTPITKQDLYAWGLSGVMDSATKRKALAQTLDLPGDLSANAFLCALNLLYSKEEVEAVVTEIGSGPCAPSQKETL